MNKFDTTETTIATLTDSKKPDCVVALTNLFYAAQDEGLNNREAYWKAELTHLIDDHDGLSLLPRTGFKLKDDDEVRQGVIDSLMHSDADGTADEKIDIVLKWYTLCRAWGGDVYLSFRMGIMAGEQEWNDTHDMDEADAIAYLNTVSGNTKSEEMFKDALLKTFYDLRNKGNSVRESVVKTFEEANRAILLKMAMSSIKDQRSKFN